MPLFMDIHLVGEVSVEETRKAHLADLAVQEKYGVKYHQYWFNEEAGAIYCLMEGPDKESCAATHKEANGITACQIIEVEGGMYDLFIGENQKLDHGLVRRENGKIDTGYRYILTLDIIAKTKSSETIKFSQLKLPSEPKKKALQLIAEYSGKEVRTNGYDNIVAVFEVPEKALKCAREIQKEFLNRKDNSCPEMVEIMFTMGISVGQPLTETEGFFVEAIRTSRRLCFIAGENEIIASMLFNELCDVNEAMKKHISLRTIKSSEQKFLDSLLDIVENHISDHDFSVALLSRNMGVSRPQLYRKVSAITGRSPVTFIRDIRLNRALSLIKENRYNLSEIALEIGYNSPSYFSKCFREAYGVAPSRVAAH